MQKAEELFGKGYLGSKRSMPSISPGPNGGSQGSVNDRSAVG